jgi:G3E family GTPase
MQLLIVSGFLGSGKSTFIIEVAKEAAKREIKTAILVNEIGEIGIDDQFMRQLGLNVWEILGGCICCTLAADLNTTLDNLIRDYKPDIVLLEPSGAADLRSVNQIVSGYEERSVLRIRRITIVDPLRLQMMMEVLTPLVTSQIKSADLILINKADAASTEEMAYARQTVRDLHPNAEVLSLSAKDSLEPALFDGLVL